MDRHEWQKLFEAAVNAYESAAFRPELSTEERERGAKQFKRVAEAFESHDCIEYLTMQLRDTDDRRRNTAARLLSTMDDAEATRGLWSGFLMPSFQRIAPSHVLRSARIRPLPVELSAYIPALDAPTQAVLVRALLTHPSADARALLWSLVEDSGFMVGEVAVDAASAWNDEALLVQLLHAVDGDPGEKGLRLGSGVRAALHLGLIGSGEGLGWLIEKSQSGNISLASMACVALGLLGRPETIADVDSLLGQTEDLELLQVLEAANHLGAMANAPALADVILRYSEEQESDGHGSPADHAMRILEGMTGRRLPENMAGYDLEGNSDRATRMRASMLFKSILNEYDEELRYVEGELLTLEHHLESLASLHRPRSTRSLYNLKAATGYQFGFELYEDLVGNQEAIRAWRGVIQDRGLRCAGDWWWQGESIDIRGTPKALIAS